MYQTLDRVFHREIQHLQNATRRFCKSLLDVSSTLRVGYLDETALSQVFDLLHNNWSNAWFFSTLFSVLDILMKHSHSCLIYYMIIGVTRRFFNSLLCVGYPDETLSLVLDISHDNWSYMSFFQLSSLC